MYVSIKLWETFFGRLTNVSVPLKLTNKPGFFQDFVTGDKGDSECLKVLHKYDLQGGASHG